MKVHAAIARALIDHDVDVMFGLLGDSNLFVVDSFARDYKGSYVAAASEAGAVLMASGYACASGGLGVATVTQGPGLTNTATALVEAVRNRTPVLLIVGDTPAERKDHLQNIAQREIVVATGAGFEQVSSPQSVVKDLAVAARRALVERRPVVLNVPTEFQWSDIEYEAVDRRPVAHQSVSPDLDAVDRALGIAAVSRRPIILAGRGAISDASRAALLRLSARLGAPVATTLKAKDLFRGDPFDLGIFGTLSHPVAVEAILSADCIIAFGAGLNEWTTSKGTFVEGKRIEQCDLDHAQLGGAIRIDAGVVGDCAAVADTMVQWLDDDGSAPSPFRSDALAAQLAAYTLHDFQDVSRPGNMDLRRVLLAIDAAVPSDRTLVSDGGQYVHSTWKLVHVPEPRAFVFTVNFGSIGLGMGSAVGAGMARPGRPVLLVIGDGGFMLSGLNEFSTAVRHGVDLITVVCNNNSYASEHIQFRQRGMDPAVSLLDWPEFAAVADALGGRGITIREPADLDLLPQAIEQRDRPLLIDVKLDPDQFYVLSNH
ncbi:MAG: thiamine pyrophosphate-binding protein [Acidimicrobiia bacterium]